MIKIEGTMKNEAYYKILIKQTVHSDKRIIDPGPLHNKITTQNSVLN